MKDKKAVEINVATIIVVVLCILVLVILALYFTGGMKTLWEKITGIGYTYYNQADIDQAKALCTTYCTTADIYTFCTHEFTIREEKNGEVVGSKTVHCDEPPINALKAPECEAFRDVDCSQYRESEAE